MAALGAGGDAGGESTYVENKGKFNTSTLALVASFVAALLVIYLLGLQNNGNTTWTTAYLIYFASGEQMGAPDQGGSAAII